MTARNLPAKTTSSPDIGPGLKALLHMEPSSEVAVRTIATTPILLAEVEAALPALKALAAQPAGAEGVRNVVGRRLALYPPSDLSGGGIAAWWTDYITALQDVPESALEAGMQAWIKRPDSRFMPKPGELRQLSLTAENRAVRAYERAKSALDWSPPKTYERYDVTPPVLPKRPEATAAEKARIRQWARDYASQAETKKEASLPTPPTHGKVDGSGITPAMRNLMQRRGDQ